MNKKEIHPFKPFISEDATKLIIGTTPPPRFSQNKLSENDVNFYYGSEDNNFWNILGGIAGIDFKKENSTHEIEKRKLFLKENHIGICDIIFSMERSNPNSALDNDLISIEHLNLVDEILTKYPNIDTLLYTSEFVQKQMTQLLKKIYGKEICHLSTNEDKKKKSLTINNKKYNVVILYSPSNSGNRGIGKNAHEKKIAQYKKYLDIKQRI